MTSCSTLRNEHMNLLLSCTFLSSLSSQLVPKLNFLFAGLWKQIPIHLASDTADPGPFLCMCYYISMRLELLNRIQFELDPLPAL